jgi:hypothetical protein
MPIQALAGMHVGWLRCCDEDVLAIAADPSVAKTVAR